MKKFRFYHWFGSCTTETYIRANNQEEAEKKFRELKGDKRIISIEQCR